MNDKKYREHEHYIVFKMLKKQNINKETIIIRGQRFVHLVYPYFEQRRYYILKNK